MIIIDDYRSAAKPPELRFTSHGPSIPLQHNMTLWQLEQRMIENKLISEGAEFYCIKDGNRFSKSVTVAHLTSMPSFRLKVDDWKVYHVHCEGGFR